MVDFYSHPPTDQRVCAQGSVELLNFIDLVHHLLTHFPQSGYSDLLSEDNSEISTVKLLT